MIKRIIRILVFLISVGLLTLTLMLTWNPPTIAQVIPDLNWSEDSISPESYIPIFTIGNLELSPVFLDGTMLGTVESFVNLKGGDSHIGRYSSAVRSHVIHSKLQKILDSMTRYSRDVLPQMGISALKAQESELRKQLTTEVSEEKGRAVVLISFPKNEVPEVLYTVTEATIAKPRFGGSQPLKIAERTAKVAKNALIQAWQERQTPHLLSQARHSLLVLLALTAISLSLKSIQKRLNSKKRRIKNSLDKTENIQLQDNSISDSSTVTVASEKIAQPLHQILFERSLLLRQSSSLNIFYRTILFWIQLLIWTIGIGYLSSLFHPTRSLSNWIIGVTINGAWSTKGVNHWPPVDWFLTFGQEANLGLPLLIILLLLISRLILTGGDFLIDFLIRRWREEQSSRKALRLPTLSRAFKGWLKVVVYLLLGVTIFYHLHQLGTITQAIAVFLGFASFALSLASQDLLKDLIGGLLILWEDQYAVGDVIVIGDQGGLVEKITLRVTQLRNLDGELITIPNRSIEMVRNLSSDWSQVNYAIEVGYDADVDRAIEVIEEVAQQLYRDPQWQEQILEAPEILGIDNISHTGILIRLLIKTQPLEQWSVAREFRRRLKKALDKQGIKVGIPQQMMYFSDNFAKSKMFRENN